MKLEVLLHLLDIGDEPRLKSEQVANELRHPPDKWMSVQPHQLRRKVGRNGLRHKRRSRMQTIDNRELYDLNALCTHYDATFTVFTHTIYSYSFTVQFTVIF